MDIRERIRQDYYDQAGRLAYEHLLKTGELLPTSQIAENALQYADQKLRTATDTTRQKMLSVGTIDYEKQKHSIFNDVMKHALPEPTRKRSEPIILPGSVTYNEKYMHPDYDPKKELEYQKALDQRIQESKESPSSPWYQGQQTTVDRVMSEADKQKRNLDLIAGIAKQHQGATKEPEAPEEVSPSTTILQRLDQEIDNINKIESGLAKIAQARSGMLKPETGEQIQPDKIEAGQPYTTEAMGRTVQVPSVPQYTPESYEEWSMPSKLAYQGAAALTQGIGSELELGMQPGPDPQTEPEKFVRSFGEGLEWLGKGIVEGLSAYRGSGELQEWAGETPKTADEKVGKFVGQILGSLPYYMMGYGLLNYLIGLFGPTVALGLSQAAIQREAARQAIPTAQSAIGRIFQNGVRQAGQTAARIGALSATRQAMTEGVKEIPGDPFNVGEIEGLPEGPMKNIGRAAQDGMVAGALLGFVFGTIAQAYPEAKYAIQSARAGKKIVLSKGMGSKELQAEIERLTREGWELRSNGVLYKPPVVGTDGRIIEPAQTSTITLNYKGKTIRLTDMLRQYGNVPAGATVSGAPGSPMQGAPQQAAPFTGTPKTGQPMTTPPVAPPTAAAQQGATPAGQAPIQTPPIAPTMGTPEVPVTAKPAGAPIERVAPAESPAEQVAPIDRVPLEAKEPWEMTREEYVTNALSQNRYAEQYKNDPKKMEQFRKGAIDKWKQIVEKAAETNKLPDEVIDDYADAFGEKAVLSTFRGVRGKGIEGWEPPSVRLWDKTYRQALHDPQYSELIAKGNFKQYHKEAVTKAIAEGKPVPPKVLKDYPDLQTKAKPATPVETVQKQEVPAEAQPVKAEPKAEKIQEPVETKTLSGSVAEYIQSPDRPKSYPSKTSPAAIHETVVPKKPNIPMLNNVAVKDGIAKSTDLDTAVYTQTDLPDGFYKVVGNKLVASETEGDVTPEDFPTTLQDIKGEKGTATVSFKEITPVLQRAAKYVSKSETSPAFQNINFQVKNGKGHIISSDTYRLITTPVDVKGIKDGTYLINPKSIKPLVKDKKASEIKIIADENIITFDTGNTVIQTRLNESKYPDVERVIPKTIKNVAVIDRESALNFLKEVKELKPEGAHKPIAFTKTDAGFEATLKSSVTDKNHTITLPAKHVTGGEVDGKDDLVLMLPIKVRDSESALKGDFVVNSQFLDDGFKSYPGKTLYMGWEGGANPAILIRDSALATGEGAGKPIEKEPTKPTTTLGHEAPVKEAPPAPLTGAQRASINKMIEIIDEIVPTRVGKYIERDRAGIYKWKTRKGEPESIARISKKFARNIEVRSHEMGHHLDKIMDLSEKKFSDELLSLPYVQDLMSENKSWSKKRFRQEGAAELINMYITDPEGAQKAAPKFIEHFERKMYAEQPIIYDKLQDLRALWDHLSKQSSVESVLDDFMGVVPNRHRFSLDAIRERFEDWNNPISGPVAKFNTWFVDSYYPAVRFAEEVTGMPMDLTKTWTKIRAGASDGRLESMLIDGQFTDKNDYSLKTVKVGGKNSFTRQEAEKIYRELFPKRPFVSIVEDPKNEGMWQVRASAPFDKAKFKKTGPSMAEIVDKIEALGKTEAERKEHIGNWTRYIVAKHAIEMEEAGLTSGALRPELGITLKSLRDYTRQIEQSQYAKTYIDQAKELIKLRDYSFQWLVDSGLYSAEDKARILGKWEWRVPFWRVDETTGKVKTRDPNWQPVKRLTGKDAPIQDPLLSIMQEAYVYNRIANTHDNIITFLDEVGEHPMKAARLLDRVPLPQGVTVVPVTEALEKLWKHIDMSDVRVIDETKDIQDLVIEIFRPRTQRGKDYLIVRRNGKPVAYEVHDAELLNALIGTNREYGTLLGSIARRASNLFRMAHITNPVFPWRNMNRDAMIAAGYSESGFIPYATFLDGVMGFIFDSPKARKSLEGFTKQYDLDEKNVGGGLLKNFAANEKEYTELWRYFGGTMRSPDIFNQDALQKIMQRVGMRTAEGHFWRAWNSNYNPWQMIKGMANASEMSTNLGESMKGMKRGFAPQKSVVFGRHVTIDHQMVGSAMKLAKDFIPFINPRIQGHQRLWRQMRDPKKRYTTLLKWMSWITLPSLAHYLLVKDNPHWQEFDKAYRDAWMLVPMGNPQTTDLFLPIPRAHSLPGWLFGAFPARAAEYLYTHDKDAFREWEKGFWRAVNPSMSIWFVQLINDLKSNYRSFSGYAIESQSDQSKPKRERYSPYTTETAKLLGAMFDWSPKKIDYALRTTTGALGAGPIAAIDAVLIGLGISDSAAKPEASIADLPVIGDFFRKTGASSSNSIDRVYTMLQEAREIKNSASGPRNKHEYEILSEYDNLNRIAGMLSDLRKQTQAVHDNRHMTPEEKRIAIEHLERAQLNLARQYFGLPPIEPKY